jgi:hypothetical protein
MKPSALVHWRTMRDNPGELAATMLRVIDDRPQHVAVLAVPHEKVASDEAVDAVERTVIREYSARRTSGRTSPSRSPRGQTSTPTPPRSWRCEHRWVGGRCVNGCPDTGEAA